MTFTPLWPGKLRAMGTIFLSHASYAWTFSGRNPMTDDGCHLVPVRLGRSYLAHGGLRYQTSRRRPIQSGDERRYRLIDLPHEARDCVSAKLKVIAAGNGHHEFGCDAFGTWHALNAM